MPAVRRVGDDARAIARDAKHVDNAPFGAFGAGRFQDDVAILQDTHLDRVVLELVRLAGFLPLTINDLVA